MKDPDFETPLLSEETNITTIFSILYTSQNNNNNLKKTKQKLVLQKSFSKVKCVFIQVGNK